MTEHVLVSIIIPTRDRGALLTETLESLRRQTYARWEALVMDDGSTDDTASRVAAIAAEDARIRFNPRAAGETPGACAARNRGTANARADLLIFLDSDDLLAEHCLAQRTAVMHARPELDFAVFPCRLFRKSPGDTNLLWNAANGEDDLERYLRKDIPWQTAGAIWRRSGLEKVGPWDEQAPSWQDWEFYLRALIIGARYDRFGPYDLYWRMPEPSRETIGNRAQEPDHVRHRARMLVALTERMQSTGQITPVRRELLAGNFWLLSRAMVSRVDRPDGLRLWGRARTFGLISTRQYIEGLATLRFGHRRKFGPRAQRYVAKRWPANMHLTVSTTQLKTPLPAADADPGARGADTGGNNAMPTLSVVMGVYNGERYLEEAVQSILDQTFRDFEFIIIDDGSTDGSGAMLEQYAAADKRIRLIRRENRGQTPSLNEGIDLARSDLIARMDADDVCLPHRFEKQVAFMQQHPGVVLLGGAYALIDARGRLLCMIDPPRDNATLQDHALSGRTPICHPLAMMRKWAVKKVGGYDPQFQVAQDLDLWLKLGEVGELACVPELLVKYRQHDASLSETKQELQQAEMRLACERAYLRRNVRREFLGDENWRPTSDRTSRHQFALRYGWWAFNSAQRRTALVYGMKAVRALPFNPDSWKLLLCAGLKKLPSPAKRVM